MTKTNRPTNPADISFAPHCFAQDGTRTEYIVARSAIHSGPANFGANKQAAEDYARKTGRIVTEVTTAVMRRVSWQ